MKNVKYIPGDLVKVQRIPDKVCTIIGIVSELTAPKSSERTKAPLYETIVGKNEGFLYLCEDEILGIPLTEEILKENGWKLTGKEFDEDKFYYCRYEKRYLHYPILRFYPELGCYQKESVYVYFGDEEIAYGLHYIHQLQHLLFGLGLNHKMEV